MVTAIKAHEKTIEKCVVLSVCYKILNGKYEKEKNIHIFLYTLGFAFVDINETQ